MNKKEFIINIFKVVFSNFCIILSGIVVGFVIPKIMGVYNYGNYKIFSLYFSYIGLFNFGYVEGIYLKYGGIEFDKIDKKSFRTYTKLLVFIEVICSVILLIGVNVFVKKDNYRIIFSLLALCIVPKIVTGYYQFISQMTSRFNELSFRNVINSLLTIFSVIILLVMYMNGKFEMLNYYWYIIIVIAILYILMIWYINTYKDITFGESYCFKEKIYEAKQYVLIGTPLLVSNLIGTLTLSMDRQVVSIFFDIATYGVYSFAYNIMNLVITAVSAISTVLYPTLKRLNKDNIEKSYYIMTTVIAILGAFVLCSYNVLIPFINKFLPDYTESLNILYIIYPIILLQTMITIVIHNYYKVYEMTLDFFKQSVIVLIISFIGNIFAYYLFKSTQAISFVSVIVMIIWYIISEKRLLIKFDEKKYSKNIFYIITMIILFYINNTSNILKNIILFNIEFLVVTIIVYWNEFKNIRKKDVK